MPLAESYPPCRDNTTCYASASRSTTTSGTPFGEWSAQQAHDAPGHLLHCLHTPSSSEPARRGCDNPATAASIAAWRSPCRLAWYHPPVESTVAVRHRGCHPLAYDPGH